MSATTVSQFAVELKMPVSALLEQLSKAGVGKSGASDTLYKHGTNGRARNHCVLRTGAVQVEHLAQAEIVMVVFGA